MASEFKNKNCYVETLIGVAPRLSATENEKLIKKVILT
jgi:hypothetical protein